MVLFNVFRVDLDPLEPNLPILAMDAPFPVLAELAHKHSPAPKANADVENAHGGNLEERLDNEGNLLPVACAHRTPPRFSNKLLAKGALNEVGEEAIRGLQVESRVGSL